MSATAPQAVFEGGDYCHKHPARSLRVKLECGGEERAWDASEPNTCAYMVHASTPAACKAEKLKELQVGCGSTHATERKEEIYSVPTHYRVHAVSEARVMQPAFGLQLPSTHDSRQSFASEAVRHT